MTDRLVGKVLGGRYRVLSPLGEGGMGTVYLCEHEVLRRRMAVKVLRSDLGGDPEIVDRFRNEAIAASRIGQRNVVDVVDFGTAEDGALYYVMEALDGRSLGAVIREDGPLPVGRALEVLEQICRALAAAHARGVVHRDVKPDNVFLARQEDGSEIAKVIDFGISHVPRAEGVAPITRAGAIMGTPEYMAPEQAAGDPIDRRSDVYAVGVLAFEMVTGELPISAATPIATLVAHQTRAPDPPSRRRATVPPEVDALVLRALAKKPEDRYPSMEAFAGEVARVRAAFVRTAPRPPESAPRIETMALPDGREAVKRATLRVKRKARVAMVAAVVAVMVVAAVLAMRMLSGAEARSVGANVISSGTATSTSAATPAPTSTPTSTPTRTATSTPTPSAIPAPMPLPSPSAAPEVSPTAPVLLDEQRVAPARPPRTTRRAALRAAPVDDLKDPYSTGGDLKDPFK